MRLWLLLALCLSACIPTIDEGNGLRYDGETLTLQPDRPLPVVYAQVRLKGEVTSPYCDLANCAPDVDGYVYIFFEPSSPVPLPPPLAEGQITYAEVLYLLESERSTRSDAWP